MGRKINAYRVLVCRPEGERPFEMPRIILRLILKNCDFVTNGINLADDRKKWRAVLNVLIDFSLP